MAERQKPPEMESFEITEAMRNLEEGDEIRVWYSRRYSEPKTVEGVVTDTGSGRKPIIDVRPENEPEDSDKRVYLERENRGRAGYRFRDIAGDDDGSHVDAVEKIRRE